MLLASLRYQLYKFSQATFSSWAWAPLEPVSDLFRYLKQTKGAECCWGWPSFSMIVVICDPLEAICYICTSFTENVDAPMAFFKAGFGPALKHRVARLHAWLVDVNCVCSLKLIHQLYQHHSNQLYQHHSNLGCFLPPSWSVGWPRPLLSTSWELCVPAQLLFPSISMLSWSRIALFLCTL